MADADDFRQEFLYAADTQRLSKAALCRLFGVSLSYLKCALRRRRETGHAHCLPPHGGRRPTLSAAPGSPPRSRSGSVWPRCAGCCSSYACREKKTLHATERDTVANEQQREQWRALIATLAPARLVFVDESGVTRSLTRRLARGPTGERVHGAVPLGHWEVTTLIGAWALDGVRASFTVDAAIFAVFVEQVLVPQLHPSDVVSWDNLPAHRQDALADLLAPAQATFLRLPPYSPDFNPIEQCWSKIKERLRAVAARTAEALQQAIAAAFAAVTPQDAQGWFAYCGYAARAC